MEGLRRWIISGEHPMTHKPQILWGNWRAIYASAVRRGLLTSLCMNPRIAYLSLYEYSVYQHGKLRHQSGLLLSTHIDYN